MAFREKFRSYLDKDNKKEPELKIELPELKEEVKEETPVIKEVVNEPKIETQETFTTFIEKTKDEETPINEKEEFKSLDLSKDDILSLKRLAFSDILQEDITISELVDLVLLSKSNKQVKSKNKDSLVIREYVDITGKITTKGKVYLEEDATKNRLKEILQ